MYCRHHLGLSRALGTVLDWDKNRPRNLRPGSLYCLDHFRARGEGGWGGAGCWHLRSRGNLGWDALVDKGLAWAAGGTCGAERGLGWWCLQSGLQALADGDTGMQVALGE